MHQESKRTSEFRTSSLFIPEDTNLNELNVIAQNSTEIHKHQVPKGYLVL